MALHMCVLVFSNSKPYIWEMLPLKIHVHGFVNASLLQSRFDIHVYYQSPSTLATVYSHLYFFFQVILHFLWDEKLESINSGSHLAMYIYQSLSAIVDSPSYENGKIINFIIVYHNPWSHIHHVIKLQQNSILITLPTHEQITNIIIKLNPCKALGLDGLNN